MSARVETRNGTVEGIELGSGLVAFRGVPYALPPVGELRWKPPQAPPLWRGIRMAKDFPARSFQPADAGLNIGGEKPKTDDPAFMSEDCLYLNICTPQVSRSSSAMPVLVWFHGGGFHSGSGADAVGDGKAFAQQDIVVVTVNYRLGALGFLDLSSILGSDYDSSGNCGLLDQIAALEWIRDNISAFGGDSKKVTIAGVSAGGKAVVSLLASPLAQGLFHKAISFSGGSHAASKEVTSALTRTFVDILRQRGHRDNALNQVPPEEIIAAQRQLAPGIKATWLWRPVIDGTVLTDTPAKSLETGLGSGIPLLAGTNANEAALYDLQDSSATALVPHHLAKIFGESTPEVLKGYQNNRPDFAYRKILQAIMGDERYVIPIIRILDAHSTHAPVWRYRFDAKNPELSDDYQGAHGTEQPYVWNVQVDSGDRNSPPTLLHRYVCNFIQNSEPRVNEGPAWPKYDVDSRFTMIFADGVRVEQDPNGIERRFWADRDWEPDTWWPIDGQRNSFSGHHRLDSDMDLNQR